MKDIKKLATAVLVLAVGIAAGAFGLQGSLPNLSAEAPEQGVSSTQAPATSEAYDVVEDNQPAFDAAQQKQARNSYITLGPLDKRGRCTACTASLSRETMPGAGQEREDISMVHPTGWRSGEGWERCHLIGYQLSGLNAEKRNLITGTHYFNVTGMLPFENEVADYIRRTGNHVLYRVTPKFRGKEMVARSVEMEALSVEDDGAGVRYHVEVYNKALGAEIDYKTGEVLGEEGIHSNDKRLYVINTNTGKFHYPSCKSAKTMAEKNRKEVKAARADLIKEGYEPCGSCEP